MSVQNVVEFDEGFAIIEDEAGRYLAFRESDHIEPLDDNVEIDFQMDLRAWKQELKDSARTEALAKVLH
jgi:hypothetical protein